VDPSDRVTGLAAVDSLPCGPFGVNQQLVEIIVEPSLPGLLLVTAPDRQPLARQLQVNGKPVIEDVSFPPPRGFPASYTRPTDRSPAPGSTWSTGRAPSGGW
jgi:hypothetical protein